MNKKENLASKIQIVLASSLLEDLNDELLRDVTITLVQVVNGGEVANIYYSAIDINKKEIYVKAINRASSFLSQIVARNLDIRKSPKLKFIWDDNLDKINKMDEIIDNLS